MCGPLQVQYAPLALVRLLWIAFNREILATALKNTGSRITVSRINEWTRSAGREFAGPQRQPAAPWKAFALQTSVVTNINLKLYSLCLVLMHRCSLTHSMLDVVADRFCAHCDADRHLPTPAGAQVAELLKPDWLLTWETASRLQALLSGTSSRSCANSTSTHKINRCILLVVMVSSCWCICHCGHVLQRLQHCKHWLCSHCLLFVPSSGGT